METRSRDQQIQWLAQSMGFQIADVLLFEGEEPVWSLRLGTGELIEVGDASQLLDQKHVRRLLANATSRLLRRFQYQTWDRIVSVLLAAARPMEPEPETTPEAEMELLIDEYLTNNVFAPQDLTLRSLSAHGLPRIYFNAIAISVPHLRQYLMLHRHPLSAQTQRYIIKRIRMLGAEPVTCPGWRARQHRWRLPPDTFPPTRYGQTGNPGGEA